MNADFTLTEMFLFFFAGILTGLVNTVAGSGTIISIGVMLFANIPIDLANTTNRLGVFFQNLTGIISVKKYDVPEKHNVSYGDMFFIITGALLGSYLAVIIHTKWLNYLIFMVIVGMIIYTIYTLKGRKIITESSKNSIPKYLISIVFFVIGVYGGLLQVGVGIIMLLGFRGFYGLNWTTANYYKLLVILIYTIPSTVFFIYQSMIVWKPAIALAAGQIIGAYFAGWLFGNYPKMKEFLPYLILIMLVVTAIKVIL